MRFQSGAFIVCFALLASVAAQAQSQLVSKWEKIGPVNFTALVHQSPTRIVAATDLVDGKKLGPSKNGHSFTIFRSTIPSAV